MLLCILGFAAVRSPGEETVFQRVGVMGQLMYCDAGSEGPLADFVERQAPNDKGLGVFSLNDSAGAFECNSQRLRRCGADPGRRLPQLGQRPLRNQSALIDDDNVVGQLLHLAEEVAGHQHGVALRRPRPEQSAQRPDSLRIKAGTGLIENQNIGSGGQCTGDECPLLLASGEVREGVIGFEVDPFRRHCLLEGLDDIGLTLQHVEDIKAYEERRKAEAPWLFT